jgi:hypothetical protein
MANLEPTMADLKPLLSDLEPTMSDLEPTVGDLKPLLYDLEPLITFCKPLTTFNGGYSINCVKKEKIINEKKDLRPLSFVLRPVHGVGASIRNLICLIFKNYPECGFYSATLASKSY